MPIVNVNGFYDSLVGDKIISEEDISKEDFAKKLLAPGEGGTQFRQGLFKALQQDEVYGEDEPYQAFIDDLGLTAEDTTGIHENGHLSATPAADEKPGVGTQPGQPQQPMQPGEMPEGQQKPTAKPQQKQKSYYINNVEVGKVKMPETGKMGLNLGNSQVTVGYRPGQTYTSGNNPNSYREQGEPVGALATRIAFGTASDNDIITNYVRNTVGDAIKYAKEAGLKEAESNTIYGGMYGMGATYNAAVANRRKDPKRILQDIMGNFAHSISHDENIVKMAIRNAEAEGMTVKDYAKQRLIPYVMQEIRQELYGRLLDMNLPTSTLEWFLDGFSEGLFGNIMETIGNTREQQEITNMARQITSAGQNPYFVPGHWDNFYRGVSSLTGMLPEFMLGGWGGGGVASRIFGRGATRLATMGFTASESAEAILLNRAAMGLGKRMLLTVGEGSLSGAITLGSVDAAHSVTQQLRDRNGFSVMDVAKEAGHGALTGTAFGVTGGAVGAATARAAGWWRTAAKVGKFATEAATLTGMSMYDKIKAGMPVDLGDEVIDGLMQTIAMKVASTHTAGKMGKLMENPKEAVREYLSSFKSPELPEAYSKETQRELEQIGDLVTQYAMIARGRQEYARQQQEAKGRQSSKLGIHEGGTSPEIDNSAFEQQQRQRFEQSATEKQRQILEQMKALFANPGTTWETRNLLSQAMGLGQIPLPPVRRVSDVQEMDGKYVVVTESLDGKVLERKTFDNEDDAYLFKSKQEAQSEDNRTHRMKTAFPTQSDVALNRMLNAYGYSDEFIKAAMAKNPEDRTEMERKMVDMATDIQKALVTKREDRTVEQDNFVNQWEDKMMEEMVPDDATISMTGDMKGNAYVTISDENGQVIEQSRTMSQEAAGDFVDRIMNRQGQNIYEKAQGRANMQFAYNYYESFLQQESDAVDRVRRHDELKEKKAKGGLTEEEQAEYDGLKKNYRHYTDAALVINNAENIGKIQEKLDKNENLTEQEQEIVNAQTRLLVDYSRREDVTDAMEKEYEALNNLPEGTIASIMTKPVLECDEAESVIREGYIKSIGGWVKRSQEASTHDAYKLGFNATPQQRTALLQQADEIERQIRQEKGYDENVNIGEVIGFDGKNADAVKRRIMFGSDSDDVKDLFAQWVDMQVTYSAMQKSIDYEVKTKIQAARDAAAEVTGNDGMVRGLQITGEDNQPLQAYVKDGNIVVRSDGSIDKEASDKMIFVVVPGEKEPRHINLDQILSLDAPRDGQQYANQQALIAYKDVVDNAYAPVEPVAENVENGQGGQPQGAPAEGGTPPAEGTPRKVMLNAAGADFEVEVLGKTPEGKIRVKDSTGKEFELNQEQYDRYAKAYEDNVAAAQAEAQAQAQREEDRKAKITGYAEGNPDLSHPDNDMPLVIDYLKEQEPAQQERVKTQAATHIGTLNDNIESLEADVARRREWYDNAKDMSTPENLSARKEALDKAEAELEEAKTRMDNWERIRVALMSDKELQAMKEERKASRQQWEAEEQEAQKDSKPVLSGEKTPLDKDAVLEKYETRGEANQAMLSEFRRLDRRAHAVDDRIRYIDRQLDAWRDGEPMTEKEVRALIAEREALRKEEALLGDRMAALRNAAKRQLAGWYREREIANMSESERRYAELDKATDYNRKVELAKEAVMTDEELSDPDKRELLMILDRVDPETVEEYVAANLPYGMINWEGLIGDGGRKIRGLQAELGGRRGIGHDYDTNSYNAYLAKKGEGKSPDQVAHEIWENSPEDGDGNKRWSDTEIKFAMLDLLQGAEKPTDISHKLVNDRIEEMRQRRAEMIDKYAEEAEMEAQQPKAAEAEPQPAGEFKDPVTGEVIDPNEKVPFQKVEGEKGALNEEEVALRDTFTDVETRIFGNDRVSTDWEEGQRVLNKDRERRARMMGTTVNERMIKVRDELSDTKLTEEQQRVVSVFTGEADRQTIKVDREDGESVSVEFQQGNDEDAGTKHSLYGHYDTRTGVITSEDILRIPSIIRNGERNEGEGGKVTYTIKDGKVTFTVLTEKRGEKEVFDDFYSSWRIKKKKSQMAGRSSTEGDTPAGARNQNETDAFSGARTLDTETSDAKLQKVADTGKEDTEKIFDTAKKKFGLTNDIREAGYILPDGTMLDFSGRHELFGADDSGIRGRRATDHRVISQIAYAYDAEGNEIDTGVETTMPDFIERGAIRIDANAGSINLSVKPTAAQRRTLQRLVQRNGGDITVDYGNGWDSDHYSEYEGASQRRILSDIDRYFDEGIKSDGNIKYFRTSNGEAYGFTLNGKIYIDPRIATAETPLHEYTHLWAEGMRESDPEGWKRVVDLMRGEKELWEKVKKDYPELHTDDDVADEVLAHYSGSRGAERMREEMRKIAEGDGTLDAKTRAIAALENVRRALNDFWRSVANRLGIKFTTAEEVADMVMRDFLNEVNPLSGKTADGKGRMHGVEKGDIFVSNARKAVEGIKQEKATGDQWLAMIQKAGGLKAGEDKWLGLSDWLNERKGKPVTKEEVMNFIRENQVQIEEVNYTEEANVDNNPTMQALREEFLQLVEEGEEATNSIYISDHADWALEQMRDRYGDDFLEGFEWSKDRNGYPMLVPIEDWNGGISGAARYYLGIEDRPIHSTRLQYTTEGLENKKEIALTVPTVESWNESDEIHFGDAGEGRAVAWIRFGETTDKDGSRVLVIDEIQSKRHQEGREKGYKTVEDIAEYERLFDEVNKAQNAYDAYTRKMGDKYDMPYDDAYGEMTDGERTKADGLEQAVYDASNKLNDYPLGNVPDAPFEKNWHELAMKRMLRFAVENGYDKVAWTTGEQQAERYNLAAVVNNIAYVELPNGEIDARAYFKDGGYEFLGSTWKEVEESVGKDMARRMQQGESTRTDTKEWGRDKDDEPIFYDYKVIEGDGLRIGGEGMKGFYDGILPRFMKKYGKKWGATVGEVELPYVEEAGRRMHAVDVTPEMRVSVLQGQPMFQKAEQNHVEMEAEAEMKEERPIDIAINDRVKQHDYLFSDKYVTKLTGTEFAKNEEPLTDRVTTYYQQNFNGEVEREGFGKVILDKRGVKDSLSHGIGRDKAAAFAAVPFIIKDGAIIDHQENWKGRNQDSFTIAAPVEINKNGYVGVVIVTRGKGTNRNKFYLHEVILQESLQDESFKTDTKAGSHHGDIAKILKEIVTAKDLEEKVEENIKNSSSGENFVGEYQDKPIQLGAYTKKYVTSLDPESFTNEEKGYILAAYNKVKEQNKGALAMIKTRQGYVLVNRDNRRISDALGLTFSPYLAVKTKDIDMLLSPLVRSGQAVGIVDIDDPKMRSTLEDGNKANVVPMGAAAKPHPTEEKESPIEEPGGWSWADALRADNLSHLGKTGQVPRIGSVSDFVLWNYSLAGKVRQKHNMGGKDFSRLLSPDDSNGVKVDVQKAQTAAEKVIPAAEELKKYYEEALARCKSDAARRLIEANIKECDNAIDWYQRAAKGDRTIFDDERPRMFRVGRDGKGLDKKTLDGTWTESEVHVLEQKLGGTKVTIDTEETIPETVRQRLLLGEDIKGWYDESDGSVHLYAPAVESVEDARYTICHEKLGHEGLVALLGSQQAVTDWGNFMYLSAGSELRKRMDEVLKDEFGGDVDMKSKAAQEVFAQIAEDGPRTKDEFNLWRRVKHFLIRQAQKRGWNVKGLLNDADMRYYVLKTGDALRRYEGMTDAQKMEVSQPGLMFSGRGRPRKRQGEGMASFLQRLEQYERERQREEDMRLAGAEAPAKEPFEERWHQQYEEDDAAWKERHGLSGDEPDAYPRREEGESNEAFLARVDEYDAWENAMRDQDDKRPIVWEYEQKAYQEWKDAVREFEREWGIEDEDHAALNLFDPPADGERPQGDGTLEGDLAAIGDRLQQVDPSGRPMTSEEAAAEHAALQELGDALGADMTANGAKRHTKLAVIQRRKDLEGRSAEDAVFTHQLSERINDLAGRLIAKSGDRTRSKKDLAKKIRTILPFVIEIPRRQQEIADDLNNSMVWQYGRLISVSGEDIAACEKELDALRDCVQRYGIDSEETKAQAAVVAGIINDRHRDDLVATPIQTVVSEGALGYFTDLFNTTDIRHRGGKTIPEMNADELRGWVDDIEYLRNCLNKISKAGNIENFDQIRDQLLDDMNARADKVVEQFNSNHAQEIANGGREMTRGDLLDIIWLSKQPLSEKARLLGVQEVTGSDLLAVAQLATQRLLPEDMDFDRSHLQDIVDEIGDWYANWFMDLENAGMRPSTVGRITNYVNHMWDREKPGLGKTLDENFQRTRSANMRNREIPTLMTGMSIGLTPKTTDIVDMMAYYSRHNAEALANKTLIDKLNGVMVGLPDKDGEIIASVPMLTREIPEYARDRYEHYEVPGIGDLWVLDIASKRFANVFGPVHTPGEKPAWQKALGAYDALSGTAKKIELSISGYHMGALTEVYVAQMMAQHPVDGFNTFVKFMITDCIKKGAMPCYANPEVFKDAARHLVKLGASDDYAASEVLVLTEKLKTFLQDTQDILKEKGTAGKVGAAAIYPEKLVAALLDFCNKGMDKILWTYLHDGLKLCSYDIYSRNIRKQGAKEGWSEEQIDKMLDEAGQYINDMFGGQYWEIINVSPAQLKLMQRFLLSPDWLISTNRHFFANAGFGSLYSEDDFLDYVKNNWMGLKRFLPEKYRSEKDVYRAFRSKNSKLCYTLGVFGFWYLLWNGVNAWNRKKDIEEQQKIAEEKRAAGETQYMSPYELAYGENLAGMTFWDYLMQGNALEKKGHAFKGRNEAGEEVYMRWGKQFREFPELFQNEKGEWDFPFPLMNRLFSKANPMAALGFESLMYANPHRQTHWDKELAEQYGQHIGYLMKIAQKFIPFSLSGGEKGGGLAGFFLPISKGFSFWKAKEYLKDYIENQDWNGVREVYQACALNNIDYDSVLDIVTNDIKKTVKAAQRSSIESQQDAIERFDKSNSLSERKALEGTIRNYQSADHARVMRLEEAVEAAKAVFTGQENEEPNKWQDYYLMGQTGEDVKEDMAFNWLKGQCAKYKKYVDELKEADPEEGNNMQWKLQNILKAYKDMNAAYSKILDLKKNYADFAVQGMTDKAADVMDEIRKRRKEVMETHKNLMKRIPPFDERIDLKMDDLEWLKDWEEESEE